MGRVLGFHASRASGMRELVLREQAHGEQKERLFEVGTCKYYSKGLDGTCQAMLRHKRIPILAPQSSELEDKDKAFLQTRICKLREGPERTSSQVYGQPDPCSAPLVTPGQGRGRT
eukprot:766395-Hanusia_phi.AAC.4